MRLAPHLHQQVSPLFALALSVSLLVPGSVQGQTSLSLQAGASLATLGGNDVDSADSRTGIKVRTSAILPLTTSLGLQLGAAYAEKGATEQEDGVDLAFDFDYLEIPLLLRLSPAVAGTLSPHFTIGPTLSFRVACNASGKVEGIEISVDCDDAEFADLKTIDFGAVAGAGLDIATPGSLSVSLDVLYNFGLTSISESDDVKNRAFSILAGITFPIG